MPHPIRSGFTVPYGAAFGARRAGGRTHAGNDYHAPIGTPIYGTGGGGRVTFVGYAPDPRLGLGHNIHIAYPDARGTVDAHMRDRPLVSVGQTVNSGTLLGYVGITGNAVNADPPGSHDHHEARINGVLVDPLALYGSTTAGGNGTPIEEDDNMPGDTYNRAEILGAIQETIANTRALRLALADVSAEVGRSATREKQLAATVGNVAQALTEVSAEVGRSAQRERALAERLGDPAPGTADLDALVVKLDGIRNSIKEGVESINQNVNDTPPLDAAAIAQLATAFSARFGIEFEQVRDSIGIIVSEQIATVNTNIDDQPTEFTITPKQ